MQLVVTGMALFFWLYLLSGRGCPPLILPISDFKLLCVVFVEVKHSEVL